MYFPAFGLNMERYGVFLCIQFECEKIRTRKNSVFDTFREVLCPNLNFTVENKMRNSHKRGWSDFKFNIIDWDILFPKIVRIFQWMWKKQFLSRKMEWKHWEFCPYHRIFGQKAVKIFFLAYKHKSVVLVNETKRLKC